MAARGPKGGQGEPPPQSCSEPVPRLSRQGLYWIFPKPENAAEYLVPDDDKMNFMGDKIGPPHPDKSFRPLGHISLDWCDYMNDESLANR